MLDIFCHKDLWFNNKHLLATIMWINNCSCIINKYESLKCSKLCRKCKITTTGHLSSKFGNYSGYNKMLNVSWIFSFTSYIESYISYISFVLKTKSSEDVCVCVYFFSSKFFICKLTGYTYRDYQDLNQVHLPAWSVILFWLDGYLKIPN